MRVTEIKSPGSHEWSPSPMRARDQHLSRVSAEAKVDRVAAMGCARTGSKRRGKYEHEALRGHEFNVKGHLMNKERIIDRKNNYYKEVVVDLDTGEVIRVVEHQLSEHTGRGSAKGRKETQA